MSQLRETYFFGVILFCIVANVISGSNRYNEEVEYLTHYINEANTLSENYVSPTDARKYEPNNTEISDFGTFDFIIVGSGPAGSILANRLSEINQWKILLLEAGNFGNTNTEIPNMYSQVAFTDYNWGFKSVPQNTSCLGMINHTCPMPRGKGVGGGTLINGLIYSRGSRIDFDRWATKVKDQSWSYNEVLSYFMKTENYSHIDVDAPVNRSVHGTGGLWNVEYHLPRSPQLNAFLKANKQLGYKEEDYNGHTGLGVSPTQLNIKNGRRCDAGTAFILPVLQRRQLKVMNNSYCTKILIDNYKNATGVIFTHENKYYQVNALKEVIISAGAFQSAQLLMLSGVGPQKHLQSLNISTIQDLEVGSTLRDHPTYYGMNYGTNYTEPILPLEEYVKQFVAGRGPLTSPENNQGLGFYESSFSNGTGYPDIEIMMIPANSTTDFSQKDFLFTNQTYEDVWKYTNRAQTFAYYIIALHTESIGTVRLKSKDPFEYPLIDNRFLSDPKGKDIETIYEGVQLSLKLAQTNAMKEINATLVGHPMRACKHLKFPSRQYWYCAIRQVSVNLYHPVGTCPMGTSASEGAVVDSKCQVFGVNNLRVVDGSVFPFTLAGHPTAQLVMVGEKVADLVKEKYLSKLF